MRMSVHQNMGVNPHLRIGKANPRDGQLHAAGSLRGMVPARRDGRQQLMKPRRGRSLQGFGRSAPELAARLGLEPRQAESESAVLPLHHQAVGTLGKLEPATGIEPATPCLQNTCSTVELRRRTPALRASICRPDPEAPELELGKNGGNLGGSPGTRTPNLLIKSQLLYH